MKIVRLRVKPIGAILGKGEKPQEIRADFQPGPGDNQVTVSFGKHSGCARDTAKASIKLVENMGMELVPQDVTAPAPV